MKLSLLRWGCCIGIFLWGCNTSEEHLAPTTTVHQQPFKIELEKVFQLYTSALNTEINGRITSVDIPQYQDLVYEFEVYREVSPHGGFRMVDQFYFTYEELLNTGTLTLSLEAGAHHWLELNSFYMLTPEEARLATEAGLVTKEVKITNTVDKESVVDTTATVLEKYQQRPSFSFGKHHLGQMFGLTTDEIIPDPSDTVTFSLDNSYLSGPSLFTIQVDNSKNANLTGEVLLEFDGGNSDVYAINIDTIPNDIFIVRDWLASLELVYVAPSGKRTSIMRKEEGLSYGKLIYYLLDVVVPEVNTDTSGEFVSAPNGSTEYWNILFPDKLYSADTLNFGG